MHIIRNRTGQFVLTFLSLLTAVSPALAQRGGRMGMGNAGFAPVMTRPTPPPIQHFRPMSSGSNMGLSNRTIVAPTNTTARQRVIDSTTAPNTMMPTGTVMTPGMGTNTLRLSGTNNNMLSPTMQFMLLEQAALNASLSPEVALSFMGFPNASSPFGISPLLPPGLTSLFPPGMNVTLPPTQFNPLLVNPFLVNPFITGVNPFLTGVTNPLLLSAQLNQLAALNNLALRRALLVSPTTGLLVSPSLFFLGSTGLNSLPLVGLSSLTAGGMTTPGTLPFVVALNSDITLSPEEEKEFQRKINLVKSQTGAASTTIWSATNLNVLLDDLKAHPERSGREVALSDGILQHVNIVPNKSNGNAGLLRNVRFWPELLQRSTFREEREQIESLIPELLQQAKSGTIHSANVDALEMNINLMRDQLAGMIRDVPDPQYIRAKRFLTDLESGVKVLRRPDAANYFTPTYSAKAKNVGELVRFMAKNDLKFAPAVAGDEAAYLVLYRALAIYDVSANLQQTNRANQVAAK